MSCGVFWEQHMKSGTNPSPFAVLLFPDSKKDTAGLTERGFYGTSPNPSQNLKDAEVGANEARIDSVATL